MSFLSWFHPESGLGARLMRFTRFDALLAVTALTFLALNLRSPLTTVAPIVADLRRGWGIDSTAVGLLTSIPVLCFGVLTPAASWCIARTSIEKSVFITLLGTLAGLVLRSAGGIGLSLAGTVVLGAALTVGNIVSLMIIARDFPRRSRMVTGIYTAALNVGTMLTMAATAPLAVRWGWRAALASPAAFVIPAMLLWGAVLLRRRRQADPLSIPAVKHAARGTAGPMWRRPLVWLLVVAFASHLTIYYSLTAWLPDYFIQTNGMSATKAGLIASIFQILALTGSFGVPLLAARFPISWLLVGIAGCWIGTPLGFWLLPSQYVLWSTLGGIASGGGFTVIFVLIMSHARDLQDNRRISAAVQGGGYTLSALGPLLVGQLHQAFGVWAPGFLFLTVAGIVMLTCGLFVARLKPARR